MNNNATDLFQGNILVVDDTPYNLRLLVALLTEQGYKVRPAPNGRTALVAAKKTPPDLILLDIQMPEMNGYEVCEQLKIYEQTRDVPVIFISALEETIDKVKAFSVGGIDYITKPFQPEEVLARIKTHLTIRHLQKNLQQQVAELDAFAHTVAHDLKNPLGVVTMHTEFMLNDADALSRSDLIEGIQHVNQAGQVAINIIQELLLLAGVHKQSVSIASLDMTTIVAQAQERFLLMLKQHQAEIILPDSWPEAKGYAPWIVEVWANYISNGLKYGGHPPRLTLGATPEGDGMIRFWIRDNGPGLSPEAQAMLFTEFARLNEVKAQGHGLGLSIVRRIVEKLGGQVGVESNAELEQGSLFYFTLPGVDEVT